MEGKEWKSHLMKNNRCWFRARISHEEIFKCNTIDIELSDFYGCLKDSVKKPLVLRLRMRPLADFASAPNDEIVNYYAGDAMHRLKHAIILQAEQFFDEFYHYNIEDLRTAIKECIEWKEK
jgi:hypothetical protein